MSAIPFETPAPEDYRAALLRAGSRLGPFASGWHFFRSVASTNDLAASLSSSAEDTGLVIVAETQTAGRGRQGRTWCSPPGAGLYVSVVCRPAALALAFDAPHTSLLTLMAGVALAEAIQTSAGLIVQIKWPNDLLRGGRKLAGILAEAHGARTLDQIVLGFGINLRPDAYPDEIRHRVTSLEAEAGRPVQRAEVLVEALVEIADGLRNLSAGRFDAILNRWRERSPSSHDAPVEWLGPDGPRQGRTAGIDDSGALLVRVGSVVERVVGGDVRWL